MTETANPPPDRGLSAHPCRHRLALACAVALLPLAAFTRHGAGSTGAYAP